jgi:hypothetical protein
VKKRVTRLITALALGTLAATGITVVDDLAATPQDTAWGAGDTTVTVTVDAGTVIDTIPGDTAWG